MWVFFGEESSWHNWMRPTNKCNPFCYILISSLKENLFVFWGKKALLKLPNITPFFLSYIDIFKKEKKNIWLWEIILYIMHFLMFLLQGCNSISKTAFKEGRFQFPFILRAGNSENYQRGQSIILWILRTYLFLFLTYSCICNNRTYDLAPDYCKGWLTGQVLIGHWRCSTLHVHIQWSSG